MGAVRMSPVDPRLNRTLNGMGFALVELRRLDDALAAGKKAIRQHPTFPAGYRLVISALSHLGRDVGAGRLPVLWR
jgi:adenylate cyclase